MKHTVKATIRVPANWWGMNFSDRELYLAGELRLMADKVSCGHYETKAIMDRNGNTVAIEVKK